MSAFLAPTFGVGYQSFTNQGLVNAGGFLKTYLAGSTTPQSTWTDSTQATSNGTSITLDSAGRPPQEIWLATGVAYKFIVQDANNVQIAVYDNVTGINDTTSASTSQWVPTNLTPTYVSGTQFTVAGDQTAVFQVGRRIQYVLASGTKYGSITASSFGAGITTVTVLKDVTALDNTLTSVSVGLLTPLNRSDPSVEGALALTITAAGGTPVGTATGNYTKIADRVFFDISVSVSSWGGATTGQVILTGLPYTAAADAVCQGAYGEGSTSSPSFFGAIASGSTALRLYKQDGNIYKASDGVIVFGANVQGFYRV